MKLNELDVRDYFIYTGPGGKDPGPLVSGITACQVKVLIRVATAAKLNEAQGTIIPELKLALAEMAEES